jgi:hypothetical protein
MAPPNGENLTYWMHHGGKTKRQLLEKAQIQRTQMDLFVSGFEIRKSHEVRLSFDVRPLATFDAGKR